LWGSSETPYIRLAEAAYNDGEFGQWKYFEIQNIAMVNEKYPKLILLIEIASTIECECVYMIYCRYQPLITGTIEF